MTTVKQIKDLLNIAKKNHLGTFPDIEALIKNKPDNYCVDLLDRNAYIATKLWQEDDVREQLEQIIQNSCIYEDIEVLLPIFKNKENLIANAMNSKMLQTLHDCTDSDWEIINMALYDAIQAMTNMHATETGILTIENNGIICYKDNCTFDSISHEITPFHILPKIKGDMFITIETQNTTVTYQCYTLMDIINCKKHKTEFGWYATNDPMKPIGKYYVTFEAYDKDGDVYDKIMEFNTDDFNEITNIQQHLLSLIENDELRRPDNHEPYDRIILTM